MGEGRGRRATTTVPPPGAADGMGEVAAAGGDLDVELDNSLQELDKENEEKPVEGDTRAMRFQSKQLCEKLNEGSGYIFTPSYPSTYSNNDKKCWIITFPNGVRGGLVVKNMEVEYHGKCLYDAISVHDGDSPGEGGQIAKLCGYGSAGVVPARSSVMRVDFKADYAKVLKGAVLEYGPIADLQDECVEITESGGFRSGNFPRRYSSKTTQCWRVKANRGDTISLKFSVFRLERGQDCRYDRVEIYKGGSVGDEKIATFCGRTIPRTVESHSGQMFIVFRTDKAVTYKGFTATVTITRSATAVPVTAPCVELKDKQGTLSTQDFHTLTTQTRHLDLCWIIAPQDIAFIDLSFSEFSLSGSCADDRLEVYDSPFINHGSTTLLSTVCGADVPGEDIRSDTGALYVRLVTAADSTAQGFTAHYTTVAVDAADGAGEGGQGDGGGEQDQQPADGQGSSCTHTFTVDSDTDLQLDVPATIGATTEDSCVIQLETDSGKLIRVKFLEFSLDLDCSTERLEVQDGSRVVARRCGDQIPGIYVSSTNHMSLRVVTPTSTSQRQYQMKVKVTQTHPHPPDATRAQSCGKSPDPRFAPRFSSSRIVGGEVAAPHSWPWQVEILLQGRHWCGGSVLSSQWVITAAHCVHGKNTKRMWLRVGLHNRRLRREDGRQRYKIKQTYVHQQYHSHTTLNDIALLKVNGIIQFTDYVTPVCLPRSDVTSATACVTTGWGDTKATGDSTVLNQLQLPIIENTVCNQRDWYSGRVKDAMFCAGFQHGGKDSCQGDSGGPLVCPTSVSTSDDSSTVGSPDGADQERYVLYGLTSWGVGCAMANKPGVYTRVSAYIDWIDQITGGNFYD